MCIRDSPKPFNLKYIGIGNEDLITDIFEERFTMIFNAVKEKYPCLLYTSQPIKLSFQMKKETLCGIVEKHKMDSL